MRHALAFFMLVLATPANRLLAQGCLKYEPDSVVLRGTLITRGYAGPPNYSDTTAGDRAEHPFILQLDTAICVNGDPASELNVTSYQGVQEVQLVVSGDSAFVAVRALVGRAVRASGTLFEHHTGHHRTPVLLTVKSLAQSNKRMDQPSAHVFKGSRMTERPALIRVRSPRCAPSERLARRSCANR